MVETMHEMGFKVILWKVPFVDFDSGNFSFLKEKNFLVLDPKGKKPAGIRWWNGESALVDLSNPEAFSWFTGELKKLQAVYGIDGFKLDLFAGATLVESPELTSDAIAAQTGSNRVEGNSSRQFTLFFDTNAEGVTVAVLTGTYTDGLGNVLQTEDDFDVNL